jgi:hypothetical protein
MPRKEVKDDLPSLKNDEQSSARGNISDNELSLDKKYKFLNSQGGTILETDQTAAIISALDSGQISPNTFCKTILQRHEYTHAMALKNCAIVKNSHVKEWLENNSKRFFHCFYQFSDSEGGILLESDEIYEVVHAFQIGLITPDTHCRRILAPGKKDAYVRIKESDLWIFDPLIRQVAPFKAFSETMMQSGVVVGMILFIAAWFAIDRNGNLKSLSGWAYFSAIILIFIGSTFATGFIGALIGNHIAEMKNNGPQFPATPNDSVACIDKAMSIGEKFAYALFVAVSYTLILIFSILHF